MNQTTRFAIFLPAPSLTRRLQYFEGSSPLRSLCWHICDRTESPSAFCQLPISAPFQLQQREEAVFAPETCSKTTSHLVLFFLRALWWFDFFGFWIFSLAVMFYELHKGWQLRLSPDIQEVCLHSNNWHGWNITAFKPVWGLSASVTSVCRAVQTHPFIHNQVISRPGRAPRPLPFFSSRRCRRQVGGQVCPLIQNDNLPPEPVAWRHRFARLDRAEAAASQSSKGQRRSPCSGAATGVKVSQRIMKLFVYGRGCFAFIKRGWKGNLQLGEQKDSSRQWINEPSESLGLSCQSIHCEGLYSVKSKATWTIKPRFTNMGYIFMHS